MDLYQQEDFFSVLIYEDGTADQEEEMLVDAGPPEGWDDDSDNPYDEDTDPLQPEGDD